MKDLWLLSKLSFLRTVKLLPKEKWTKATIQDSRSHELQRVPPCYSPSILWLSYEYTKFCFILLWGGGAKNCEEVKGVTHQILAIQSVVPGLVAIALPGSWLERLNLRPCPLPVWIRICICNCSWFVCRSQYEGVSELFL